MKRLFFLHSKNEHLVCILNEDTIINFESDLEKYLVKVEQESKQIRFNYNTIWTQKWAFKKIKGGKSFVEGLVYKEKSFWYPLEYFVHCDERNMSVDAPISRILIYIDCINKIFDKEKPNIVFVENNMSCFNKLVVLICEKRRIKVRDFGLRKEKMNLYQILSNNQVIARAYINGRIHLRSLIGKIFCKKTNNQELLILTSDRLSNKMNETDFFWGSIIKKLDEQNVNYKVIEYDRIDCLSSLQQIIKRYTLNEYDAQFIGVYYTKHVFKEIKQTIGFLKQKFNELDQNENFRNSFNYKGILFYDLIKPRLEKIFLIYSIFIADAYAVCESIIEKENPEAILVDHEKNYYGRALITEAKKRKIKTIAFEGEMLYESNNYLIQTPIKEILNTNNPIWRPIPDIKFLWGKHSKEWYIKKNYFPEKNIKIIGAPKYDFIKELNEHDKQEMFKKHDVPNKLITVITMDCPWEDKYLSAIFKTLNNRNDLKIIIKTHPNDLPKVRRINELAEGFNININVVKYENSSKLIYASDFVITYISTLVNECILMNKKVVLVDFSGININPPFVKEGLLRLCKKPHELKDEILKNEKMNEVNRQIFIKKYLYSDDGKAAKRAIKILKYKGVING